MRGKLILLEGNKTDELPVYEEVVEACEFLLEKAKAGALTGFCMVGILGDRDLCTMFTRKMADNLLLTVGGLDVMKDRIKALVREA